MIRNKSIATPSYRTDGIIIGIDPGLARTGIGVIIRSATSCKCLEHKVIRTDSQAELAQRLAQIASAVREACAKHKPDLAAIERTFVNENYASSLALGQARGAALAVLGEANLPVAELAPNSVKRQLTGDSLADKSKVALMVRHHLGLPASAKMASDASDALAIAISCTIRQNRLLRRRRRR